VNRQVILAAAVVTLALAGGLLHGQEPAARPGDAVVTVAPIAVRPLGPATSGRFPFTAVIFVGAGLRAEDYTGTTAQTLAVAVMEPAAEMTQERVEVELRARLAAAAGCRALVIVQRDVAVDDWRLFREGAAPVGDGALQLFAADVRLLRVLTGRDDISVLMALPTPATFAIAGAVGVPTAEPPPTPTPTAPPAVTTARAPAASHPRLVDVETTACTDCHEVISERSRSIHEPAADDCTTCHDVDIGGEGTQITLADTEPDLCLACHDDLEEAVAGDLEAPHAPVTDGCLDCHRPHASDQPHLLTAAVPELCTDCHDAEDLASSHSGQITRITDCVRCHRPHGAEVETLLVGNRLHPPFADGYCDTCHRNPFADKVRLRARGERICLTCHGGIVGADRHDGLHHPAIFSKGAAGGCVSCHDPHMSDGPALLLKRGAELCRTCHEPIVTAALADTGHAAAEECTDCHAPHRADNVKLLLEPPEEICETCHDLDEELSTAHLGADLEELRCVSCHTPHGSGHEKLLAATVHPPVLDGCDDCHDGSVSEFIDEGSELCLMCHDDISDQIEAAAVPHGALEVDSCTACHNPHASPQQYLIKAPGAGPCAECHDEMVATDDEFQHGIIELIGCRACHEPHGSENETLLRRAGNELCLSCHDPRQVEVDRETRTVTLLERFEVTTEQVRGMSSLRLSRDGTRGHPVAGHRVVGAPTEEELRRIETTFTGELGCQSCHDPHKGSTPQLLLGGAGSAMGSCATCHPK